MTTVVKLKKMSKKELGGWIRKKAREIIDGPSRTFWSTRGPWDLKRRAELQDLKRALDEYYVERPEGKQRYLSSLYRRMPTYPTTLQRRRNMGYVEIPEKQYE